MANGDESEQTRVTYSVKELLNRIDGKLDNMAVAIAAKATRDDLTRLDARVAILETGGNAAAAVSRYRKYLAATIFSSILALAALSSVAVFHVKLAITP